MKDRQYFLEKAQENMPKLFYKDIRPECEKEVFDIGESFVLDLGNHYVGKFSFSLDIFDDFIDAPAQLTIRFGENEREINDDFSVYNGTISRTWLQEETVFVDTPSRVEMPRRYACRYVKITVNDVRRPVRLFDFCFTSSTSADMSKLEKADISDKLLKKIDEVSINTLKECMQTFFEDGPKRDRRIWIGDFRLEALVNHCTFDNREIVKRCLYLFAAGDYGELGFLPSYIYETPYYFSGRDHLCDYALLYVVTLCDYFDHSHDIETVNDILSVCKHQLDSFDAILDAKGIVTDHDGWFVFIDWCEGLRALTSLQGVYLYTLERFSKLLAEIGDKDCEKYEKRLLESRKLAKKHLYNPEKGVFQNDLDGNQLSVHSQVWMILGGAISGDEGKKSLLATLDNPDAKQPFTPYMRHYVVEAMIKLGMLDEAKEYIKLIWGGMIDLGADTFYEVYVPGDPEFSPYRDRKINSLCHAWSCTPSYFIRKYFV